MINLQRVKLTTDEAVISLGAKVVAIFALCSVTAT